VVSSVTDTALRAPTSLLRFVDVVLAFNGRGVRDVDDEEEEVSPAAAIVAFNFCANEADRDDFAVVAGVLVVVVVAGSGVVGVVVAVSSASGAGEDETATFDFEEGLDEDFVADFVASVLFDSFSSLISLIFGGKSAIEGGIGASSGGKSASTGGVVIIGGGNGVSSSASSPPSSLSSSGTVITKSLVPPDVVTPDCLRVCFNNFACSASC